ncbi:MAG: response regulator [Gammaproteobacteria bacterium]|nr:response regulator [Gammaproteobacteria bacterium]
MKNLKKIDTLIVDDEALARRGLKLRLDRHEDINVVGQCTNGREALAAIPELNPDLVFLDIQMPGMDGFDVIRQLQGDDMPMVVFATAFDQYAIKAFDVHAIDYILKPLEDDHLSRALQRVRDQLAQKNDASDKQRLLEVISDITGKAPAEMEKLLEDGISPAKQYPEKIAIKDAGEITLVPLTDIEWVDAAGDYMCIHASGQIHIMRTTMKQLESQLDPALFQRIHRSTLVNLNRVDKISSHINGEYNLILKGGARLKMSRSYKDKIQHFLN